MMPLPEFDRNVSVAAANGAPSAANGAPSAANGAPTAANGAPSATRAGARPGRHCTDRTGSRYSAAAACQQVRGKKKKP